MTTIELSIFSPRWGGEDTCTVELEPNFIEITMGVREVRCEWRENTDPLWSGEDLQHIMQNDNIYPPAVVQDMFEKVWTAWRKGEIDDQQAETELKAVAEWLNTITRAKPRSDFWRAFF